MEEECENIHVDGKKGIRWENGGPVHGAATNPESHFERGIQINQPRLDSKINYATDIITIFSPISLSYKQRYARGMMSV
jgi:hypothetical protein